MQGGNMAEQDKNGWVWTKQEKEELKPYKTKLQRNCSMLEEQIIRFKKDLPAFADEAETVAKNFLDSTKIFLDQIDVRGGKKYLKISPEEAIVKFYELFDMFKKWDNFTNRDDVRQENENVNLRESRKLEQFIQQLESKTIYIGPIYQGKRKRK